MFKTIKFMCIVWFKEYESQNKRFNNYFLAKYICLMIFENKKFTERNLGSKAKYQFELCRSGKQEFGEILFFL